MANAPQQELESARIGRKVAKLRRQHGISSTELARRVGISQPQVSRLENGKQGFRSETLLKISGALGVHPGYFYTEEMHAVSADHKRISSDRERIGRRVADSIERQFGEVAVTPAFQRVLKQLATTLSREDSDTRTLRHLLDSVLQMSDTQRMVLLSDIRSQND